MTDEAQDRGTLSRRSVSWLILFLVLVTLGLFAVMTQLFLSLNARQNAAAWSVREDALWAAFQADRESSRLKEALRQAQIDPEEANIREILLRYDVLYSRAIVLGHDYFATRFENSPRLSAAGDQAQGAILGLEPMIDDLATRPEIFPDWVGSFLEAVKQVQTATGELVMITNQVRNEATIAERMDVAGINTRLARASMAIAVLFVSIVAVQSVQLRHIRRSRIEIERLSERNARNAERAEAANRAKSMFLATMSHEIRTPLNGLIGTAELMAQDALTCEQTENLRTIRKSGELLLDVINDILDISKMEAGGRSPSFSRVPLPCLIDEVAVVMRDRARQAGLALRFEVPRIEVTTDAGGIRQVLVNLVGNAVKFTVEGNVTVEVTHPSEDRLLFAVRDTGIGIPADGIARLFMDFSQIDGSASRAFTGTGLGLAISRRIIESLGGRIGVESIPGVGSRFWFEVPVTDVVDLPTGGDALSHPMPDAQPALPCRFAGLILVVEDNEINRKVVTGMLGRLGLAHRTAEDGAAALRLLEEQDFDLVLMDYMMPVMNGIDATRAIRARGSQVPIVGLTANAFVEDREACLAAGMDDFIAKPVTREKLVNVLRRFCGPDAGTPETSPAPSGPHHAAPADLPGAGSPAPRRDRAMATVPEPAPDKVVAIDRRQVTALVEDLGIETMSDLVFGFRGDALSLLSTIDAAWSVQDFEALDGALHALKGAARTIGLFALGELAQAMREPGPGMATERATERATGPEDLRRALDSSVAELIALLETMGARTSDLRQGPLAS
ncbi:MAG: response regulator [Rubellimicrobium sp.]|nr:response regulator [Rubellimicrobium sp.]